MFKVGDAVKYVGTNSAGIGLEGKVRTVTSSNCPLEIEVLKGNDTFRVGAVIQESERPWELLSPAPVVAAGRFVKGSRVKMTGYPDHPDHGREGVVMEVGAITHACSFPSVKYVYCEPRALELLPAAEVPPTKAVVKQEPSRMRDDPERTKPVFTLNDTGWTPGLSLLLESHGVRSPEEMIERRRVHNSWGSGDYDVCGGCAEKIGMRTMKGWIKLKHGRGCLVGPALGQEVGR